MNKFLGMFFVISYLFSMSLSAHDSSLISHREMQEGTGRTGGYQGHYGGQHYGSYGSAHGYQGEGRGAAYGRGYEQGASSSQGSGGSVYVVPQNPQGYPYPSDGGPPPPQ